MSSRFENIIDLRAFLCYTFLEKSKNAIPYITAQLCRTEITMQKIIDAVELHRDLILEAERFIWEHPETGYKEFVTSEYLEKKFRELGYETTAAEGLTGFYTEIDTGRPGPKLLILGELDSVICPAHKDADPLTGAVHSCGHNAQCAALLGIAAALREPGMLDGLSGKIMLCAVPAEELLEIEYRKGLIAEGKIKYLGGKNEFLYRGYFDGVDLAFMVHTAAHFTVSRGSVGCITKNVIYKGKAAHAGSQPWNGNNALYAASCGLSAVNAIRETFRESDIIRVHPIITHGGDMVNAIPARVQLESYVRGNSFEGILDANKRVNRALVGAAISLGVDIEIIDTPGYAPLINDKNLIEVAKEAADEIFPELGFTATERVGSGSTDMGDLSCIMPVIHPYMPGATGESHGSTYEISDPNLACVGSAKWQLAMLKILLRDGAARAKEIVSEFEARFGSKEEYFRYIDGINTSGNRVTYLDDGTVNANIN